MMKRFLRLLRHRWFDERTVRRTIPSDVRERLLQRVRASEQRHSGEIRIFIEAGLPMGYLWLKAETRAIIRQRALTLFGKLRVWDTEHNNGVLIYLLLAERAIEIVADRGINRHLSPQQWQGMILRMRSAFREGQFEEGLTLALEEISAVLVQHFPLQAGAANPNELPDAPLIS
ncbi:MAG: TPM domain-containing protein [Hylemonella sp.]|nr:TPM domain-containing protein [Hylemonella sp.]MDP1935670.1 TPM domain-containing protein [Hylemonella sp.]